MILLEIITVALLYHQVTMDDVSNAKYTIVTNKDCIYIYNSQNAVLKEKICDD